MPNDSGHVTHARRPKTGGMVLIQGGGENCGVPAKIFGACISNSPLINRGIGKLHEAPPSVLRAFADWKFEY